MVSNSKEIFKPISGHENYAASNLGRVKRIKGGRGTKIGHILKPKNHQHGYSVVDLSTNNKVRRLTVARAVCLAFHGPAPSPKHHALHSDGNPQNDSPENVRWGTVAENMADADKHGTLRRGSKHQNSKITEKDVIEMRNDRKRGMTFDQLSKKYGITGSNCCAAINGRQWSHVV